jgi:hypothetical protein
MINVYAVYSNSKLPLSPLIRWQTGSKFSHVGVILEKDEKLITPFSLVTHSALSSKGVKFTTLKTFIGHASNHQITKLKVQITEEQYDAMWRLARIYEGAKYDLKGAVGLGVGENWQDDDAFWCSEWFAFIMKEIGVELAYLNNVHRISPKHNLDWPQDIIKPF